MKPPASRRRPRRALFTLFASGLLLSASLARAAPDEETLGRAAGYPPAPSLRQAYQPRYIVGSFSGMDGLSPSCSMAPSAHPVPLPQAAAETAFHYSFQGRALTLDDYMQRQRATAVLVVKDGEIVAERFNYGRSADMRMLSNSMGKTVTMLGLVKALEEGHIRSFDDTAASYVPALKGTLFGETKLVNLMRMASGARFVEDYSGHDDRSAFNAVARRLGVEPALHTVTERAAPQGERFDYSTVHTEVLGLVLAAATGRSLCSYLDEKVWQPIGAEARATWLLNPVDGVAKAGGGLNATVLDYARLGMMLADDGLVRGQSVVSAAHLLAMTSAEQQPEAFRPGRMDNHGSTFLGYGWQVWLLPGAQRRFMLLGIYGQAILVDPASKLVIVHTAVGRDASGDASGTHLGAERMALFRGIVGTYERW